jgi:hypothetical protein
MPTGVGRPEIMSLPAPALGSYLHQAARGSPHEAGFKPAWLEECWLRGGPTHALLVPTKDALAIIPASTRRTDIFLVTDRDL